MKNVTSEQAVSAAELEQTDIDKKSGGGGVSPQPSR